MGIGIFKRNGATVKQRSAAIDEAIVVGDAFEDVRVNEDGRGEGATGGMNVGDSAAIGAPIADLNQEYWDPSREWLSGGLPYFYITQTAPLSWHLLCFTLSLHYSCACMHACSTQCF